MTKTFFSRSWRASFFFHARTGLFSSPRNPQLWHFNCTLRWSKLKRQQVLLKWIWNYRDSCDDLFFYLKEFWGQVGYIKTYCVTFHSKITYLCYEIQKSVFLVFCITTPVYLMRVSGVGRTGEMQPSTSDNIHYI